MRLLGYTRVSTEEQARAGHSLAMQPERIAHWCAARDNMELIGVIRDEGVSAGTPLERRKGGAELIRRLQAGEADGVGVYRLDRLFRDTLDGLLFFRGFANEHGIVVHSITELIDTSTPQGQLNLNIQLSLAEYERAVACQRTRAVTDHLRATGRVYGSTPYGCVDIDGRLYRDPETWRHRETIVELACTPVRGRRMSLQQIAHTLETMGIAAPRGGSSWSKTSVSRVVATHDGLNHIPPLTDLPETDVSAPVKALDAFLTNPADEEARDRLRGAQAEREQYYQSPADIEVTP